MNMNSVGNFVGNDTFAKFAKGTAGAVYVMTGIKAIGRPYFICKDKNADENKKKYAATSEFLYQLICLGITVAMIPFFKNGGLKFAQKYLKQNAKGAKVVEDLSKEKFFHKPSAFGTKYKEVAKTFVKGEPQDEYGKAMAKVNGSIELGSFIGSIIGLTMIAPPISHAIVHPIMKAMGMTKAEPQKPTLEQLQQPAFSEAHHKKLEAEA